MIRIERVGLEAGERTYRVEVVAEATGPDLMQALIAAAKALDGDLETLTSLVRAVVEARARSVIRPVGDDAGSVGA